MTVHDYVQSLRDRGLNLWNEEGKLRYRAVAGALSPELRAEIAARRDEILALLASESALTLCRVPRNAPLPLTFEQERLWFLDQLTPENSFYNISTAMEIAHGLNEKPLQQAIAEVVNRHETLRTTFDAVDGRPFQVVADQLDIPLTVVDLGDSPESERRVEAQQWITNEVRRAFDLNKGPLLRVGLLRLGPSACILYVAMHHIISDGWSLGVFFREIGALYMAFAEGRPSPLPALPIQYADYAAWQRRWLAGPNLERLLEHWRSQLASTPPMDLCSDRPRPVVQSYLGAYQPISIPRATAEALKALGRSEGATPFMVLLAGFQALLCRYTEQEDISVGSYVSNRSRAEVEGLIGFFINTLVLRTDLSGDPTFRELVRRVREVAIGALSHQALPFSKLVEHLQPDRDLSRNPLFQVVFHLFTVERNSADRSTDPPSYRPENRPAIFDLVLELWEGRANFSGGFEYNADLFEPSTIERMAGHFLELLRRAAAEPDRPLSEIEMVSAAERSKAIDKYNQTDVPYAMQPSLARLFELRSSLQPDDPAFYCGRDTLSFGALNSRANQLARLLRHHVKESEGLVAVCVERSLDLPLALLAVFKARRAYLPLDPTYPPQRLAFMLRDSGGKFLVTRGGLAARLGLPSIMTVDLEADRELIDAQDTADADWPEPDPSDLAYVIYTSGSTGVPKGVAVEHGQILNRLQWMWAEYPFVPGEVGCQRTPMSFVDSLWELLGPLLQGVPSVIVPDADVSDLDQFLATLGQRQVTRIWLVPSLLRALLQFCPGLARKVPALRFWVTSGEALSSDLLRLFRERMPGAALYNLYGTSEVWDATWYDPPAREEPSVNVPIGHPIANCRAYVLDRSRRPAPVGVPGELYIAGIGVARGYVNQPPAGANPFMADPFQGGRMNRTGDRVRWRGDGQLEYLGRIDRQVKIRGHRVEPAEIEAGLMELPGVKEAAVVVCERAGGDRQLVAYVVGQGGPPPQPSELRSVLRSKLPEFLVPATFVAIDRLPLTPSGKVDRLALLSFDGLEAESAADAVPPRTETERVIVTLWSEVLNRGVASIHSNFFSDLGGHSLLATQVISRIRERLGAPIPLRAIFERPTVAALAEFVVESSQIEVPATPGITRIPRSARRVVISEGEILPPHNSEVARDAGAGAS
jgi:amino acid adenylation domain-containing protein